MMILIMTLLLIASIVGLVVQGITWYYVTALIISAIYFIIKFKLHEVIDAVGDAFGD